MITVTNLRKIYKRRKSEDVVANNNISLQIEKGQIIGLFGHNGAGKTTLVNQLIGLITPDSGQIEIDGEDIIKNPSRGRFLCAVQPQGQIPFNMLTPTQVVGILGNMRGGSKTDARMKELFKNLDIEPWANTMGVELSGGIKRLVSFCMAAINAKDIMILDEPTNDVDPVRRRYLWKEINALKEQGKTILLVTHNIKEAENIVDHAIILDKGKILVNEPIAELMNRQSDRMRLEIEPTSEYANILPDYIQFFDKSEESIIFSVDPENIHAAILWAKDQKRQNKISDYKVTEKSLEDIYVSLTGGSKKDGEKS
ncbi:MAG: ABC transporter ATP-binding protein [Defluviitaleaceae bacterium]|nr:ABC transporter ATP-binding protein [Defluviitaleaceae bacterium]